MGLDGSLTSGRFLGAEGSGVSLGAVGAASFLIFELFVGGFWLVEGPFFEKME